MAEGNAKHLKMRALELDIQRSVLSAALRNLDLPEVVDIALAGLGELVGAHMAAAFVSDEESGRLRLAAQHGIPADFLRWMARTSGAGGVFARALEDGEGVFIKDLAGDDTLGPLLGGARDKACLVAFPMKSPSRIVGLVIGVCPRRRQPGASDWKLLDSLGEDLGTVVESIHMQDNLHQAFLSTIKALAGAIDAKDAYTRGHSDKVVAIAVAIAGHMGLDSDVIRRIRDAGYLHDIGKIGTPDSVLSKEGPLTDEEMTAMRLHPGNSQQILKQALVAEDVKDMIRHHHERYDGSGYPDELAGGDIPLGSRILCVADAFEAMTSNRPYRGRLSEQEAVDELKRWSGKQFDPEVVEAFLKIMDKVKAA